MVCDAFREAGIACSPRDIHIEPREERWVVRLPGERIAWFPTSHHGLERLETERRVLRLLAERCGFQTPRLIMVSARGFDLRQMVPGRCDPWGLFRRCRDDPSLAQAIGRSLGATLAEQHTRIGFTDVRGWLRERLPWPEPASWIRERIPQVIDDRPLIRAIEVALARYEAAEADPADCALVHGDIGLHNLAVDPLTDEVNGIFDYDGAAWADRHHDFRYLLFDVGRKDMLEAALKTYEPAVGRLLDRDRIQLYNAACAISYLAFRVGTAPEQKSCGRTLAEDVQWVRAALAALG